MSLVGPLAAWELLRLGRSGALPKARVALALTMLVALGWAYHSAVVRGGGESIAVASRVAENYLVAYLAVQTLAVVVLTPAVAAGAISDEKERGRLDFLRSSMLTPREIVLGKYLGRVLHLLSILATGLPILALATLFGGVDVRLLAAGTLVTVTTVCALAAYSVSQAVKRATLRDVMVTVYFNLAAVTLLGVCCGWVPLLSGLSPIWAMVFLGITNRDPRDLTLFWLHLGGVLLCHGVVTGYDLRAAVRDLAWMSDARPPDRPSASPTVVAAEQRFVPTMPEDDDDPFAWRERHFAPRYADGIGETAKLYLIVGGTLLAVLAAWVFVIALVETIADRQRFTTAQQMAQLSAVGVTVVLSLLLAVRTASSVAAERERDTLTPLLVLPVGRRAILWAKWFAPLRWSRYALLAVAAVEYCVAFAGGITPLAALTVVAQFVAALLLANTLGLWTSVTCRTATRAVAWTLLTLLTLSVAPLFVTGSAEFSPPAGVWLAHESPAFTPVALQLLAAGVLGWSAVRRFERYGK